MHAAFALAQDLLNWPSPLSEAKAGVPGRARMRQCITLAVLVHVWLVLVFGTAPGGSAQPGEGAWGRLSVRLEGPPNFGNPDVTAPADNGPVGEAKQQRSGGTVRPESSQKLDQAGAAKTGAWKPIDSPNEPLLTDSTVTPVVTPSTRGLSATTPNAQNAQSTSIPTLPSAALDQLQPMSTSRLSDSNTRADAPQIAPLAKPTQATRSADLPAMAVPSLDGLKPMSTATLSASGTTSPELPAKTSEKLSRVAPAPTQRNELNQMNVPSLDGVKPMSMATLDAASANTSVEALRQEKAAAMSKLDAAKATTSAQDIGAAPKVDVAAPVAGSPAPGQGQRPAAVASGGSPDAGSQKGHDVATAPSAAASKPALNLNLPQRGPLVRGGSGSGMLAVVPTPPDTKKNAMEKAVKKAEKADCRNAYAGAGILAPAAAVIDAVAGKGCTF